MTAAPAPLFDVVAVAANGAVQSRRVSAQSEQQATQQLQVANLRVLSCRPASAPRWALAALRPHRRARLEVGLFAEELAPLGWAAGYVHDIFWHDPVYLVALHFTPEGAFQQTPGPGAGAALCLEPGASR